MRDHAAVAGQTIATRVLEELRCARRPLDDDELAHRLGVSPRQTINQVCRGLERAGRLRRYTGPEGKIVNDLGRAVPAQDPPRTPLTAAPGRDVCRQAAASGTQPGCGAAWPGHPILATELSLAGFEPLELQVTSLNVHLPSGRGCEWTTIGEVPDASGLYAFTLEDDQQMRVAYVGLTEHLWMVTKGRLPGGGARGGQRYGRPRHAGATRQRVNILIAEQLRAGRLVRHWVRKLPAQEVCQGGELAAGRLRAAGCGGGVAAAAFGRGAAPGQRSAYAAACSFRPSASIAWIPVSAGGARRCSS
jgi:hypothetical protein